MADLFTSLVSISSNKSEINRTQVPGMSPVMKDGIWNERAVAPTYRSVLYENLAAYYKLDGNALDALGVHNGTGYGAWGAASPPGYYVAGKLGQAFSMTPGEALQTPFDGWHQTRIDISPVIALGTSWSISAWIKFGGTGTSGADQVINHSPSGYGLRAQLGLPMTFDGTGFANTALGTGWNHLVVTYDTSTIRYYLNGVADGTYVTSYPMVTPMYIDRMFSSQFDRVPRSQVLDEAGVWTRTLSLSEVVEINNGGAALAFPF